ncbi:MAG: 1-aminocyclopropane-1-carboxylate deaminase/D-cysteine desulfhydrase [Thalassotalea sp.]
MKILSPIEKIIHPLFSQHQVSVYVKRDEIIHPIISGNKWRKLASNIEYAKQLGFKGILSFGGAYSNHLHALAYAGQLHQLSTIAIVRGEPAYQSNPTLSQAITWGMELKFVDRKTYRLRDDPAYLTELQQRYPDYYIVPEGGSNQHALPGVGAVITELNQQLEFDSLLVPVGSGGTMAGLIAADNNQHQLLGVAVLKQADYLKQQITELLPKPAKTFNNWQLVTDFHGGGYGKFSQQAVNELIAFNQQTGLIFEPVYSGKMLLAALALIRQGYFKSGSTIVLLHTGGLQGIKGLIAQKRLIAAQWPIANSQ